MAKSRVTLEAARAAKATALSRFESVVGVNGIGLSRRGDGYAVKINFETEPTVKVPERIDDVEVIVEVVGKIRKLTARKAATAFHVVPHDAGWAVRRSSARRASSVHGTQREAILAARELARRACGELLIHARDGSIRERGSYASS